MNKREVNKATKGLRKLGWVVTDYNTIAIKMTKTITCTDKRDYEYEYKYHVSIGVYSCYATIGFSMENDDMLILSGAEYNEIACIANCFPYVE